MLSYLGLAPAMIAVLVLVSIWDGIWKAIGLWKSGTQKQLGWFICIFLFNTVGLLPIIYLLFFQRKSERKGKRARRKRK